MQYTMHRGGRGTRGGRGGRGRGGKKQSASSSAADMDVDVESDDSEVTPVVKRERGVKDETGSSNGKSSGRKLPASIAGNKGRSGANKTSSSSSNATSSKGTSAQQGQGQGKRSIGRLAVSQRNDNEVIDIE